MSATAEDFELKGPLQAEVMAVLWKLGAATVDEVRARQRGAKRRSYTAVQTVLNRLVERGFVERDGAASPTCTAPRTSNPNCWRAASGADSLTPRPRAVARRCSVWSSHSPRTTWTTSSATYEGSKNAVVRRAVATRRSARNEASRCA
jgi:hypothetical protein